MAPKAETKPTEKKFSMAEKKPKVDKKFSKEARAAAEEKKKRVKKNTKTYKIYIFKVLKQVYPDIGISSKAMRMMINFTHSCTMVMTRRGKFILNDGLGTVV